MWQFSPIWMALLAGLVPALIVGHKRRPMAVWYLYGCACTLVAWPLFVLPTIHALMVRPIGESEQRQRQRRADALGLLAESSLPSYPSWIAEFRREREARIARGRYAFAHIGPGEALELRRPRGTRSGPHAVAYYHRGVHLGYVPKRQRWVADALDDGLRLACFAEKVNRSWIDRRRVRSIATRIVVLYDGH